MVLVGSSASVSELDHFDAKKASRASGLLATFASLTILPYASTTHTLESSNDTSIPA